MSTETQTTGTAEFLQRIAGCKEAVAALGIAALNLASIGGAVAELREHTAPQPRACVEQACGQTALRELLEVDELSPTPKVSHPAKRSSKAASQPVATQTPQPLAKPTPKETPKPSPSNVRPRPQFASSTISEDIFSMFAGKRGIDISWPQCAYDQTNKEYTSEFSSRVELPKDADFVIVGVTGGHEDDANPCLLEELKAAQDIAGSNVSLYVNMANPMKDPKEAKAYGRRIAREDLAAIRSIAVKLKKPLQPFLWLDVERGNEWQADTTNGHSSNAAFMEGAIETIRDAGVQAGIYTAKDVEARPISLNMWEPIMGTVPAGSMLNVPEWIASPGADGCTEAPFIRGGHILLGQNTLEYPKGSKKTLDFNNGCQHKIEAKPALVRK